MRATRVTAALVVLLLMAASTAHAQKPEPDLVLQPETSAPFAKAGESVVVNATLRIVASPPDYSPSGVRIEYDVVDVPGWLTVSVDPVEDVARFPPTLGGSAEATLNLRVVIDVSRDAEQADRATFTLLARSRESLTLAPSEVDVPLTLAVPWEPEVGNATPGEPSFASVPSGPRPEPEATVLGAAPPPLLVQTNPGDGSGLGSVVALLVAGGAGALAGRRLWHRFG